MITLQKPLTAQEVDPQQIEGLMRYTEQVKGIAYSWGQTLDDLAQAEKNGLYKLYKTVFAEEPYFEKFEVEELQTYFASMIRAGGFLFTAQKPNRLGDMIVGFVASIPLTEKKGVIDLVSPYVDIEKTSYFAEDGVAAAFRRTGLSRSMKALLLQINRMAGFDTMLLRTSEDSAAQIAAVEQFDFKRIEGLTQDVMSLKLDGQERPDRRVFFTLDLTRK